MQHVRPAATVSILLWTILCAAPATVHGESDTVAAQHTAELTAQARAMKRLHSLLVLQNGQPVIEHTQGGPGLARPANIKSLSKTILSALARFGEMYRLGGAIDGRAVVPESWIDVSWQPNGHSPWTGDAYGYGWFITDLAGRRAYYGRGYGGQMLMVIPSAGLTIVMTSDPRPPSSGGAYFERQRALAASTILAAPSGRLHAPNDSVSPSPARRQSGDAQPGDSRCRRARPHTHRRLGLGGRRPDKSGRCPEAVQRCARSAIPRGSLQFGP
ncbi:MAG: serine hydrolase [Gammaproteobacteria bacterium]|nr:serine hydrolase [Gammaproteobacteria bacterium]